MTRRLQFTVRGVVGGGKEALSRAFARLMGAIELAGGRDFDSLRVPGVPNNDADDI